MLIITIEGHPGPHIEFCEKSCDSNDSQFILANKDEEMILVARNEFVYAIKQLVTENVAAIALFPKWYAIREGDGKARIVTDQPGNNGIIRISAKSSRFESYDANVKLTQSTALIGPEKQNVAKTIIRVDKGDIDIRIEDSIIKRVLHWNSDTDNDGFDKRYEALDVEHFLYSPPFIFKAD